MNVVFSELLMPSDARAGSSAQGVAGNLKKSTDRKFEMLLGLAMTVGTLGNGLMQDAAASVMNSTASVLKTSFGQPAKPGHAAQSGARASALTLALTAADGLTPPPLLQDPLKGSADPYAAQTALIAAMQAGLQSAAPVKMASQQSATGAASILAVSLGLRQSLQTRSSVKGGISDDAAASGPTITPGATLGVGAQTPAGQETRVWQVGELAHQLTSALDQVVSDPRKISDTPTSSVANSLSLTTKAKGDAIREAGTNHLLKETATGGTQKAAGAQTLLREAQSQKQEIHPPNKGHAEAAGKTALKELQPASTAEKEPAGQAELKAAAARKEALPELSASAKSGAVETPQRLEWTAQPAPGVAGQPRMPGIIEQVRQMAEFMAERTDGAIRVGQQGMEANLKLYPPDLGGVRVELTVSANRLTQAQFIVERPETAMLLRQNLQTFQDGLERHGLTVDQVQIIVRPAASAQDGGWRQGDMLNQRRGENALSQKQEQQQRKNSSPWREAKEF